MRFRVPSFVYPVAAVIAVFVGYSLFPVQALTPEMSAQVAVVAGVRPAAGIFPGLWRWAVSVLPPDAAMFGLVGRIGAAFFALLLFLTLRRAMLMLHRTTVDTERLENLFIPNISLVVTVMGVFAEPVWRAFSLFTPAALSLLLAISVSYLYLQWIEKGSWWRLCGGLLLMGVFASETPFALVFPPLFILGYYLLWKEIEDEGFIPREDLQPIGALPKWRMFLSFAAGVLIGGWINLHFISANGITGSLGWKFTYVLFHYWQEYLRQIRTASSIAGWILGIPLCVIPIVLLMKLLPRMTDDDRPMPFVLGLIAMFAGFIAYFEQGPLRGAWFWTWIGDRDLVSSATLLGFYSVMSSFAFAFAALIFVADAFDSRRSEFRERGVNLSYRGAMVVLTIFVAVMIFPRLAHNNVRRILAFNDTAIREMVREMNGAEFVFTDGSADAQLELEAHRIGSRLYAINLMGSDAPNAEHMRLRGLKDDGDVIAAKMGASALLRVWACDKPNGLDKVALQIGFDLWKREKQLALPEASAFVARSRGLRAEDVKEASVIAANYADIIAELADVANAPDVPLSVRDLFFSISWRLSRFARYRKDAALADKLDNMNTALKRMLRDLEYARLQVFLQLTPKEGLELALRRADFQDASRYAAAVLKIDKDDPRGNFGMGMYFLMANRLDDAEPFLRRVLIRRPDEPAAINNLSIICRKTRRYEEALALARRALELLPDNEDVKQTLRDAENKAP